MAKAKKKQPGRQSAASMSVVSEIHDYRPGPPDHLTANEKDLWRKITATKPPGWWDAGSLPLLESYCRLNTTITRLEERIAEITDEDLDTEDGLNRYNTLTRVRDRDVSRFVQLAMKMRLTQQARYDAQKASTQSKKSPPRKPWEEE